MRLAFAILLLAFTATAQNVTNLYIGQPLYIGQVLTTVPSSGGGGGSTNPVVLYDGFQGGTSTWDFGHDNLYYGAQENFMSSSNLTITKVQSYLTCSGDVSGRTAYVKLWNTNGTSLGSLVGTSTGVPCTNSWSSTVIDFNFSPGVSLASGTYYHFTIEFYPTNALNGTGYIRHSGGTSYYPGQLTTFQLDGSNLYPTTFGNYDAQFKIWGTSP